MSLPSKAFAAAIILSSAFALGALAGGPALAQEPERIDFAGGAFTITETEDAEKILAFDGRELARDYFVSLERIADVAGTAVAFFSVGPGGNACAPATVMAWKPEGGDIKTAALDDDCDAPAAAVGDYGVFFVPYLLPGETGEVHVWTPAEGFSLHGMLAYAPEPGTGWDTFDPAGLSHPMEALRNAGVYTAARALLGDGLADVAIGLSVASAPETSAGGLVAGRGCVPHACGLSDTFIVVDKAARAVFFAQQDEGATLYWPARGNWPAAVAALLPSDF